VTTSVRFPIPAANEQGLGTLAHELEKVVGTRCRRSCEAASRQGRYAATLGKRTMNSDPRPGMLLALTEPPCASMIAFDR